MKDHARRIAKLEQWAEVFTAKVATWIRAIAVLVFLLMSSQVPVVKEIIGVVLK